MTAKTPTGNRDKKGRFAKGNQVSQGRTKGSRNKATHAALELIAGTATTKEKLLIESVLSGTTKTSEVEND